MDEARAVLERLDRIEQLARAGAPAEIVLEELETLVREASAWLEAEGRPARAAAALERCRAVLSAQIMRA